MVEAVQGKVPSDHPLTSRLAKATRRDHQPGTYLDHDIDKVPIKDFINKELILFSMADNIRSIPSMADGLKPGQRKVIFAAFKKNLVKEIKVGQRAVCSVWSVLTSVGATGRPIGRIRVREDGLPSRRSQLDDDHRRFGTKLRRKQQHQPVGAQRSIRYQKLCEYRLPSFVLTL